jgi:GTPase SAR1 family protein
MNEELLKEYFNCNGLTTIIGTVGSGKTSFLLSLIDNLFDKDNKQLLIESDFDLDILKRKLSINVPDYSYLFNRSDIFNRLSNINGEKVKDKRYKEDYTDIIKKFDFMNIDIEKFKRITYFLNEYYNIYNSIYIDDFDLLNYVCKIEEIKQIKQLIIKNNKKIFLVKQDRRSEINKYGYTIDNTILEYSNTIVILDKVDNNFLNINIIKHRHKNNIEFKIPIFYNSLHKIIAKDGYCKN